MKVVIIVFVFLCVCVRLAPLSFESFWLFLVVNECYRLKVNRFPYLLITYLQ
jgi:hypothetical protein